MRKSYLSKPAIIAAVCAGAVIVLAGFLFWLYSGKVTPAKASVYKSTLLPAVYVNTHAVPLSEVVERFDTYRAMPDTNIEPGEAKKLIFEKLITDKKIELLAASKKIKVSDEEAAEFYSQMAKNLTGGDELKLEEAIDSYAAMTKLQFQEQVLHPALLQVGLQNWYYGQRDLNKAMHETADRIVKAAADGEEFSSLASRHSQDNATALFQGDSGFIAESELNFEIRNGLKDAKLGDVLTVPGSDGLHIVKLLARDTETDSPRVRMQHIFLPGNGYERWLSGELEKFRVTNLAAKLSF